MVDRAVGEHLEILRLVPALRLQVLEDGSEADAFDRRLRDTANMRRRFDGERFEHAWDHVDGVSELGTDLARVLDAFRPVNDEGIGSPAAIGLAFPSLERRVAGMRPAPGVVVEIFGSAEV